MLPSTFIQVIIVVIAFLFAVTFHEFCHALIAYWLGDDTAKRAGRLTLNPLAHVDPLGLLFLVLFRIGWAVPVPMDERNFKYPRLFSLLSGLAGPLSNFLLALISLYGLAYVPEMLGPDGAAIATQFFKLSAWVNVMLGVFNLLPLPPLDGSHIIRVLLPDAWLPAYYSFMRFSFLILLVIILFPTTQALLLYSIEWTQELLEQLVI